jgi:hypothetical protein
MQAALSAKVTPFHIAFAIRLSSVAQNSHTGLTITYGHYHGRMRTAVPLVVSESARELEVETAKEGSTLPFLGGSGALGLSSLIGESHA